MSMSKENASSLSY